MKNVTKMIEWIKGDLYKKMNHEVWSGINIKQDIESASSRAFVWYGSRIAWFDTVYKWVLSSGLFLKLHTITLCSTWKYERLNWRCIWLHTLSFWISISLWSFIAKKPKRETKILFEESSSIVDQLIVFFKHQLLYVNSSKKAKFIMWWIQRVLFLLKWLSKSS